MLSSSIVFFYSQSCISTSLVSIHGSFRQLDPVAVMVIFGTLNIDDFDHKCASLPVKCDASGLTSSPSTHECWHLCYISAAWDNVASTSKNFVSVKKSRIPLNVASERVGVSCGDG